MTHIDNDTVAEITETITDTVTNIDPVTVTAIPEPWHPDAPAKPVSERDARILELAATGMKKRTIGTTLGIPESTVRWVIKQHGDRQ